MNLREQAKGRECQIRSHMCNKDPETVVLCHIHKPSISGGMGKKAVDILGGWGCSACHDLIDGRGAGRNMMLRIDRDILLYEAVFRTQNILLKEGKI